MPANRRGTVNAGSRQPLLIVGAGGLARETAQAVLAVNEARPTFELLGHLDDDPARQGTMVDGIPVLGPVDAVADHPDALVVVATGRPTDYTSRCRLVNRLALDDDRAGTVVHPAASVAASASIGPGSVLLAGVTLTAAVTVGRHVAVMPGTVLTHDDRVDDFATLAAGVLVAGGVHVHEGAYIGAGARIREGLSIGAWALVGMGSLVTRDVPAGELWFGAPARCAGAAPVPGLAGRN